MSVMKHTFSFIKIQLVMTRVQFISIFIEFKKTRFGHSFTWKLFEMYENAEE